MPPISTLLILSLLLLSLTSKHTLTNAAPEDYVEPSPEDEEWEEDEELIIRDDGTVAGEKPKLPARPPFTLHDYNATLHAWVSPVDEVKSLKAAVGASYERTRGEFGEEALKVKHMLPFVE